MKVDIKCDCCGEPATLFYAFYEGFLGARCYDHYMYSWLNEKISKNEYMIRMVMEG